VLLWRQGTLSLLVWCPRAAGAGSRSPGVVMSGCRPLIKGYFGVALVVGAVMSSAFLRGEFESAGPDVVR
jgi:hypothetical protein